MNILLIHGLGRTPLSLWGMAAALKEAGHQTHLFGYVTIVQSFDEIAERLRDRLRSLSGKGSYGIVSHSMGGLLTRAALADADFPLPAHVVMLEGFITDGANGCLVIENKEIVSVAGFPAKAIDTVGAGDSFAGGVLYGLSNGLNAQQSARWGNYMASCIVQVHGARLDKSMADKVTEIVSK